MDAKERVRTRKCHSELRELKTLERSSPELVDFAHLQVFEKIQFHLITLKETDHPTYNDGHNTSSRRCCRPVSRRGNALIQRKK